jgi:TP901 family phage tail tape measure protein
MNVTGMSAQEASDSLTALWNNFASGTDNLELFVDKIALLGASTASSVEEITTGLEKFAAIADTVGMSFDYAAAAMATITAETRQSEEVVGTALKTIFARMEGLKLGETLDDGTTLNQYS